MMNENVFDNNDLVRKYLPRNFTMLALDGIFFFLGMIFLHLENVIPVLIKQLGGGNFHISMIPVLHTIGLYFPSILVASFVQSLRRKKPFLIVSAVVQRLPWLAGAIAFFFLAESRPDITIWIIIATVFLAALGGGISIPAFFNLTAKTVPVHFRGKLFALRNVGSYLLGIGGAVLLRTILDKYSFPENFSILLFLGWGILMLCVPGIIMIKEPDSLQVLPRQRIIPFIANIPGIIRSHRDFHKFIIGRMLLGVGYSSSSYFAVSILNRFDRDPAEVGIFTAIITVTFIIVNPVLGVMADRKGHKKNMVLAGLSLVAANLIILFSPSYIICLAAFVCSSTALSIRISSEFSMTLEFCNENQIPTFIGIAGIYVAAGSFFIALIGKLAETYGLSVVFALNLGFSIMATLCFRFWVREPRHQRSMGNGAGV